MIQTVVDIIRSHQSFLVVSHVRPDGDSLGSQLALALILELLGKEIEVVSRDPVPTRYRDLPGVDRIRIARRALNQHDATFILECSNTERPGIEGLDRGFLVNIDHHHSTRPFGNASWIDPSGRTPDSIIRRTTSSVR